MILGVNQKIHFKTKGKFKGGFFSNWKEKKSVFKIFLTFNYKK